MQPKMKCCLVTHTHTHTQPQTHPLIHTHTHTQFSRQHAWSRHKYTRQII